MQDLGGLTVDMVKALAGDGDSREVNLKDLTNLVSALAESSVLVDNPQVSIECQLYFSLMVLNSAFLDHPLFCSCLT